MIAIILRTLLIYALLTAAMRLTGKRQIGELQLSELLTTLLISEIAANPIVVPTSPMLHAIVPILLIVALELGISYLVTKSSMIKKIFDGKPSFLIDCGKINQKELRKQRISIEELLSALRQKGYSDPGEVSYAIMEQDGTVSVFAKEEGGKFAHPIVIDGKINPAASHAAGLKKHAIQARLRAHGCSLEDAFLFTITDEGKEFLARREKR